MISPGLSAATGPDAVEAFEHLRRGRLVRARLSSLAWVLGFCALFGWSLYVGGFFTAGVSGDPWARMGPVSVRMAPHLQPDQLFDDRQTRGSLAHWYYNFPLWLDRSIETVEMAVVGTAVGAAIAFPFAFIAARNLSPLAPLRFTIRRIFELLRTIPDVIFAIVMAAAFGVGPMVGVMTLVVTSAGSLGKLFAEAIETADAKPVDAVMSVGGGWVAQVRFGVLPQVLPILVSYALLRLEINLAGAVALGVVGAGGIGIELDRAITYAEFDTFLAILLMIIAVIFLVDMASEFIRHRLMGLEARK